MFFQLWPLHTSRQTIQSLSPPISWEVIQCRWPGDPRVAHGWASVGTNSGTLAQSWTHPLYFTGARDQFSCWVPKLSGSSILPLNILLVLLEMVVNCLHGIFYPVSLQNLWFTQSSTPILYTRPPKQSAPESVIPSAVIFRFVQLVKNPLFSCLVRGTNKPTCVDRDTGGSDFSLPWFADTFHISFFII